MPAPTIPTCSACHRSDVEFYEDPTRPSGCSTYCKTCNSIKNKARVAALRAKREAASIANPPPPLTEKVCLGCGLLKPIEAFGNSKKGKVARCRACLNAARNPDPAIVQAIAQRKALRALGLKMCNGCGAQKPLEEFSPDARSPAKKQPRCKECAIAWQKRYRDTPIGAARSKAVGEAWRAAHPDEIKAMGIAYREANPEKRAINNAKRNARLNEVEDTLTDEEVKRILKESKAAGHPCTYCGKSCGKRPTLDHIFPIAGGGPNSAENLTVACKSCNSKKHARSVLTMVNPKALLIVAFQTDDPDIIRMVMHPENDPE